MQTTLDFTPLELSFDKFWKTNRTNTWEIRSRGEKVDPVMFNNRTSKVIRTEDVNGILVFLVENTYTGYVAGRVDGSPWTPNALMFNVAAEVYPVLESPVTEVVYEAYGVFSNLPLPTKVKRNLGESFVVHSDWWRANYDADAVFNLVKHRATIELKRLEKRSFDLSLIPLLYSLSTNTLPNATGYDTYPVSGCADSEKNLAVIAVNDRTPEVNELVWVDSFGGRWGVVTKVRKQSAEVAYVTKTSPQTIKFASRWLGGLYVEKGFKYLAKKEQ